MTNWLLALLALVCWVSAFAWYFEPEIKRWWARKTERFRR
jgi:hypothetical protein